MILKLVGVGNPTISAIFLTPHHMFLLQVILFLGILLNVSLFRSLIFVSKHFWGLAVLGWQNTCESVEDIAATLAALNTEIDISIMYRGLDPKSIYSLASVVRVYYMFFFWLSMILTLLFCAFSNSRFAIMDSIIIALHIVMNTIGGSCTMTKL